jgi:hypothetical protein
LTSDANGCRCRPSRKHSVETARRRYERDRGRLGIDSNGLHEAAGARSQQMFWTSLQPTPLPRLRSRLGRSPARGCTAPCAARLSTAGEWDASAASATVAHLLEAVRSDGAQCEKTGVSRAALARYGLRCDRDQPALAKLAPAEAVEAVRSETGMTAADASDGG